MRKCLLIVTGSGRAGIIPRSQAFRKPGNEATGISSLAVKLNMALRFIELPLLQRAPVSVYRYYSKTAAAHERSHPAEAPAVAQFDSPDVATAGKTTREVLRGWLVFKLFTYDYLVDNSLKVRKV